MMSGGGSTRILIVGSGFAGLGMAIRLKEAGFDDFVILERADDVGGTWRDNVYPGCACDVPSHLYSFSFAPNPTWSRTFSGQQEIWDYLRRCVRDFGLLPHMRFAHNVTSMHWEDEAKRWHVDTSRGSWTANVVIAAMGPLSEPSIPDLPGLEQFEGTTFHSATWDSDYDLAGKSIAVIGTGASAIQFVPKIQPKVGKLHVFQRTPPWIMPRPDRDLTPWERTLYRYIPIAQLAMRASIYWARELYVLGFMNPRVMRMAHRIAERHLRRQVPDPELRRRLRPNYTLGCKRVLLSNDYLPALVEPNVELVTDTICEIRERSIVTSDGRQHEVDAIVFGTGFHVTDPPALELVRGRRGVRMADAFGGSPQAYKGTTFAGFPNLFMLVGPNTGLGHTSGVFMIESQISYVLDALRTMEQLDLAAVEIRSEVHKTYNEQLQHALQGTVWNSGGCASWYLDANGRNSTIWPGFTWSFRRKTRRFDRAMYDLIGGRSQPASTNGGRCISLSARADAIEDVGDFEHQMSASGRPRHNMAPGNAATARGLRSPYQPLN